MSGTAVQDLFTVATCDNTVEGAAREWREFARVTVNGEIIDRDANGKPLAVQIKINGRVYTIRLQNANQAMSGCRGIHSLLFTESGGKKKQLVIQLFTSNRPTTDEGRRRRAAAFIDSLLIAANIIGAKPWMSVAEPAESSGLPPKAAPRSRV